MAGNEQHKDRVVVAIGVFDGVHLGHQALFARARSLAGACGALAGAVTFDPTPYAFFSGDPAPLQITLPGEKAALLAELGLDRLLVVRFSRELAEMAAEAFVERLLEREFDLAGVVVGHDFRFGAGRRTGSEELRALGARRGFAVEIVAPVTAGGERVSSTRIRKLVSAGQVAEAGRLMGRPLAVDGRVITGQGLGRRLQAPTANLEVSSRQLLPAAGVYAVAVELPDRPTPGRWAGAANVGPAPTVGTGHERLIEVHLIDFVGDLRGERLRVAFEARLRDERRFESLGELRAAIAEDIRIVRQRWSEGGENHLARPGSL